jgi:hypothetical protein
VLSVELIYIPLSCDRVVQAFFPNLGSLSLSICHGVVQAFFPTLGPEHPPHIRIYIHTYIRIYIHTDAELGLVKILYICTYIYVYVYAYRYMYVCMYACMYVCMYVADPYFPPS